MAVHSFHEGAHVLRVHVGVKAVAQVGDVALRAETLQHLLHDVGNALLKEGRGQRSGMYWLIPVPRPPPDSSVFTRHVWERELTQEEVRSLMPVLMLIRDSVNNNDGKSPL